ncbi:unnamed protein product [Menidia menidia]|uniref:(Atlantic silverside) hypothetical protein n=1 Tax=Menidia menidia TaxID=238744 RepID=A0A8S4B8F6_9TELE|nr:unnamed protein product [Menidia menidia]
MTISGSEKDERMKCTLALLVLSMVVMMAEPGEGFFGLITHAIKGIHKLIHGKQQLADEQVAQEQQQLEQLDKRSFQNVHANHRVH